MYPWAMRKFCGAKRTFSGESGYCKSPPIRGRSRCFIHGGLTTGPRSVKGLAIAMRNLKQFRHMDEATLVLKAELSLANRRDSKGGVGREEGTRRAQRYVEKRKGPPVYKGASKKRLPRLLRLQMLGVP